MKKIVIAVLTVLLLSGVYCNYYISADEIDLPILMYHSVDDTGGRYSVTAEKLESDIKGLKAAGYTMVSFDEVIGFVHRGEALPEKSVVITFDDGYENNYSVLLPLAQKLDFKFEVFTVAGFIEYSPYAMKWNQVKALDESEHGSIGCHTHNLHSYNADGRVGILRLEGEDFRQWEHILRSDLNIAKGLFIEQAGKNVKTFAYPNGKFSAEAEKVLREEGYLLTVSTEPGINKINTGDIEDLYLMLRISMDGQAYSAVDMIKGCAGIHSSKAVETVKRTMWDNVYVSRKKALIGLYGEKFKSMRYGLSSIAGYSDLKYEDLYTRAVFARCVENNIISGFPDWTMRPNHYITRGEFAVLLARCTNYDGRGVSHTFTDSEWWNDWALSWCFEKGYMIGYGEDFGVNDFLTAEQIDLVMARVEQSK